MFKSIRNSELSMALKDSSLGEEIEDQIDWTVYLQVLARATKDSDIVNKHRFLISSNIQDEIIEEFKQILNKYKLDIIKELKIEPESNVEVIVDFYTENNNAGYFIVII